MVVAWPMLAFVNLYKKGPACVGVCVRAGGQNHNII